MTKWASRIGLSLLIAALACAQAVAQSSEPEEARLREEVTTLASPAFQGRRNEGGRKAAAHLVAAFRALKLEPLFGEEYTQEVPCGDLARIPGRNVGAMLRGSDPTLRGEWVIVSAHYDHLGVRDGVLYPGADDNASGVAMMLEVARSMVRSPDPPRRGLMFVGFDLEEVGLFGSRYFVEHPPVPLGRVALFLTADMIGRSLGGVCDPYVFVMGSENAPALRPWIDRAALRQPVKIGLLGSDVLLLDRSDYGPFRARKVPYLFFSTGENPTYHSPRDTADTLDYRKLEAISRVILGVVRQAATAEAVPKWSPAPDNPVAEAATIRDILSALLENRERLKIGAAQVFMMRNTLRRLESIVAKGSITPSERAGMVNLARVVLISVL